jgi:hypothetical protein
VRDDRERQIADAYRRGYTKHPQREWVGEAGLAAFATLDRAEGGRPL